MVNIFKYELFFIFYFLFFWLNLRFFIFYFFGVYFQSKNKPQENQRHKGLPRWETTKQTRNKLG
jgi:hypothetical protein